MMQQLLNFRNSLSDPKSHKFLLAMEGGRIYFGRRDIEEEESKGGFAVKRRDI